MNATKWPIDRKVQLLSAVCGVVFGIFAAILHSDTLVALAVASVVCSLILGALRDA